MPLLNNTSFSKYNLFFSKQRERKFIHFKSSKTRVGNLTGASSGIRRGFVAINLTTSLKGASTSVGSGNGCLVLPTELIR